MHMLRTLSRTFAIAASAAWMLAPSASSAATNSYSCLASSFGATGDGQGNLVISCTDPTAPPPPSTTCAITPSSTALGSAGNSALTMTASSGCGTVSSWTVTSTTTGAAAAALTGASGSTATFNFPSNALTSIASYTVGVTGSTGTPTNPTATVTVAAASASPPPTGSLSFLGMPAIVLPLPWVSGGYVYSQGFQTTSSVLAVRFTPQAMSRAGSIRCAEYGGGPALRMAYVFDSAGNMIASSSTASTSPMFYFTTGAGSSWVVGLTAGSTYYMVIKNLAMPGGQMACTLGL